MKYVLVSGSLDQNVDEVIYDSRKARPDSVFVCIQGSTRDSHEFIPDVLKAGCKVLVIEKEVEVPADVTVIRVENGRLALAELSAARFGYPAEKLITIGITGTKGKTTTSYMIKAVLEAAGKKTGLIGTNGAVIGDEKFPDLQYDSGILCGAGVFPQDGGGRLRVLRDGGFLPGTDAAQSRRDHV